MMKTGAGKSDASLRRVAAPNPNLNHTPNLFSNLQSDEALK
jgi:hypothetical protein